MTSAFDDLLEANRRYAEAFDCGGYEAAAQAGVALVTCMDSRIDPLAMLGLRLGDAKVFRNPGARVTEQALEALVLGVHLLKVHRILVVPHTKCAMASNTVEQLREKIAQASGQDASWLDLGVVEDQEQRLRDDVARVKAHPLIPEDIEVAGFVYDVDSGLLHHKV